MRSKKGTSQKNATQRDNKVFNTSPNKKENSGRYNPPNPIPTLKDRPKPESTSSQPSKQETTPSSSSRKD